MQNYPLSIELFIDEDIQVVLFLLNIDWHVDTLTSHSERNWLCVILILEEDCKLLEKTCKLVRNEGKLDFCL